MEKAAISISIFLLGGFIGFKILGLEIIIFMCVLLFILMFLDIILGFVVARVKKQVSSRHFTNGLIMKVGIWGVIGVVCSVSWHLAYIFKNEYIGLIALVIIGLFLFGEFTSIVEHLRDLGGNKYENRIIQLLFSIFNFGFEKGTDILEQKAKEKIEEKFKIYSIRDEKSSNNPSQCNGK